MVSDQHELSIFYFGQWPTNHVSLEKGWKFTSDDVPCDYPSQSV